MIGRKKILTLNFVIIKVNHVTDSAPVDDSWKNSTFTRKMSRISRDSSEALDDDRLSLASSDNSSSHRLNDVGDVQNLARLQEESKSFFPIINFSGQFIKKLVDNWRNWPEII